MKDIENMILYFVRKFKLFLKKRLEKKFVILGKKKALSSSLVPWREEFFEKIDKRITGEVKTILEIGDGDGALSYKLSQKHSDCFFYGIDIETESFKENNYYHLNMDSTEIVFQDNFFDLIISHNVFEHIHNLGEALEEMIRVLKPDGKMYAYFAPIWTSAYGHHFYNDTGEVVDSVFPPYVHLSMSDEKLKKYIPKKIGLFSMERIQAENYLIGGCNNKLRSDDYRKLFLDRKDFEILKFDEITDHHHNNNISDLPTNLLERYRSMPKEDLRVIGFEIEGRKVKL
ncbi:class I SAM-dependent methyltransferase [Deltaproteobacteria bacterium TL4]